jgi:catechol 2,3-dioxygenase-like lactoylglutathione lyase family enzyme
MIRGVKFVSIPVRDQEASLKFYTEKLGFEIMTDQAFGKQRWVELGVGGADARIILFTLPGQESQIGQHQPVTFWTDNVQKTYQELNGKGVHFVREPKKEHWGTSAIFKDLDGNQFVLSSR